MACSAPSVSSGAAALGLLLLAGCGGGPARPGGAGSGDAPAATSRNAGWRMLSAEAGAAARPAGYVEIRQVAGPEGGQGLLYLVYDEGFRPVGHVTEGGNATRYAANEYQSDQPLERGLVSRQFAVLLGVRGPLAVCDLQGKPKALP